MVLSNPRTDHSFKIVGTKLQSLWLLNPLVWHVGPSVPSVTSEALPLHQVNNSLHETAPDIPLHGSLWLVSKEVSE